MKAIVSIVNDSPVTTSLAITDGVGNQHKNVMELIRNNAEDLNGFGGVAFETRTFETAGGKQKQEYAILNEQQATLLMTYMKNTPVIKEFKFRLVKEFFEMAKSRQPKTFAEALRLAADLEEAKEKALLERDQAIQTKAEIGSRREATAMATASVASRKAEKLAAQLGISTEWKQVKAIPWLGDYFKLTRTMYQQVGRKLSILTLSMGKDVVKIEDSEYGTVKAYHVTVIEALKRELDQDSQLLSKYRVQSLEHG